MACNCKKGRATYEWTSEDGSMSQVYSTEIQAKAKKMRDGGSYVELAPTNA